MTLLLRASSWLDSLYFYVLFAVLLTHVLMIIKWILQAADFLLFELLFNQFSLFEYLYHHGHFGLVAALN